MFFQFFLSIFCSSLWKLNIKEIYKNLFYFGQNFVFYYVFLQLFVSLLIKNEWKFHCVIFLAGLTTRKYSFELRYLDKQLDIQNQEMEEIQRGLKQNGYKKHTINKATHIRKKKFKKPTVQQLLQRRFFVGVPVLEKMSCVKVVVFFKDDTIVFRFFRNCG